jgi:hypothetical protein
MYSVVADGLKIEILSQKYLKIESYNLALVCANFGIYDANLTHKYLTLFDSIKPILRNCPQNDVNVKKSLDGN